MRLAPPPRATCHPCILVAKILLLYFRSKAHVRRVFYMLTNRIFISHAQSRLWVSVFCVRPVVYTPIVGATRSVGARKNLENKLSFIENRGQSDRITILANPNPDLDL